MSREGYLIRQRVGDFHKGSVLAGLLHIISSNDFPDCHEEGKAVFYVDNDTDHVSDDDPGALQKKIEKEARLSVQWLTDNKLCVAPNKSKLLIAGTQQLHTSTRPEVSKLTPETERNSQVTKLSPTESSEATNRLTDISENYKSVYKIQGMSPKF